MPCPLCGGLIHPVAGRCKHCKEDLSSLRGARPQASAPLPALDGKSAGNAVPVIAPVREASQPILPPRPTGSSPVAAVPRSAWRSWPVLVILVATSAILAAVVIMVWPHSSEAGKKHALQPPPAPERMDTQSLPQPALPQAPAPQTDDPWGPPPAQRHGSLDPQPQQMPSLKDPFSDDDDALDPFAPLHGNGPTGLGAVNVTKLASAIGKHLCDRATQCGDSATANVYCNAYGAAGAMPATCPAIERCFSVIDHLSCDDASTGATPWQLMQTMSDCVEAMRC